MECDGEREGVVREFGREGGRKGVEFPFPSRSNCYGLPI